MKKPIKTYLYHNRQFVGAYDSITEAAVAGGETLPTARHVILGKTKITQKGNVYTTHPLTDEEIQKLPIKEQRFNGGCKVHVSNRIEYEVPCRDHKVCYQPRSREGKLMMLKKFIYNQMDYKWKTQPIQITELQKKFLQELFDSLLIE